MADVLFNGTVTFASGSTYACELSEAGSDKISATGDALLSAGGTLFLKATSGLGTVGDRDEMIIRVDEEATISGTFDEQPAHGDHLGHGVFHQEVVYTNTTVDVALLQAAAGDVDGNRAVNNSDLQQILAANSFNNGTGFDWTQGDFDGDTDVDNADLQLI